MVGLAEVQMLSLIAIGTPPNGPSLSFRARAASISLARAMDCSRSWWRKAWNRPSDVSIRSKNRLTTASAVCSPVATALAISVTVPIGAMG